MNKLYYINKTVLPKNGDNINSMAQLIYNKDILSNPPDIYIDKNNDTISLVINNTILKMPKDEWDAIINSFAEEYPSLLHQKPRYVGTNLKWILYSYVLDFEDRHKNQSSSDEITFICGKFAYSKIKMLPCFKVVNSDETPDKKECWLDLNGEIIKVYNVVNLHNENIMKLITSKEIVMINRYISSNAYVSQYNDLCSEAITF